MKEESSKICMGQNCKLKDTCRKHLRWLMADDEEEDNIIGLFEEKCEQYEMIEFYGG